MDSITVDMTPVWLKEYYSRTGDKLNLKNQTEWAFSKLVKHPRKLNKIIEEDGFFANLPEMPGATEYIPKLIERGADVIFLTQLPRKSDFAAKDKRAWIKKNIPRFDLRNIIFAHRKSIVSGDLLFDDNPIHLETWYGHNLNHRDWPLIKTATISYPYNKNIDVDWRFKTKSKAWEEFFEKTCDYYNLKR
jgi:5'(3')-deoxyribonucleotidase